MTYVDSLDKNTSIQQGETQENNTSPENNVISQKSFQPILSQRLILKSLGRIGICLNEIPTSSISESGLDKVCFVLINNYENEDNERGVGPLNDGYLVGLKHHRHEFKVFYLFNPKSDEFSSYLCFFLKNATQALTVFYSGRGSNKEAKIEFRDKTVSKRAINNYILHECQVEKQVMFITDCLDGGSIFDISGENHELNIISFSVTRTNEPVIPKENRRTRGIFTYYFCKITNDFPNITPNRLVDRMNPPLNHFNEVFSCETSKKELSNSPIYF